MVCFYVPGCANETRVGNGFYKATRQLGNLLPTLNRVVPPEQGVERLAIHAGLASRRTDIAPATGENVLGIGLLEAAQILLARIPPGERRQILGDLGGRRFILQIAGA